MTARTCWERSIRKRWAYGSSIGIKTGRIQLRYCQSADFQRQDRRIQAGYRIHEVAPCSSFTPSSVETGRLLSFLRVMVRDSLFQTPPAQAPQRLGRPNRNPRDGEQANLVVLLTSTQPRTSPRKGICTRPKLPSALFGTGSGI